MGVQSYIWVRVKAVTWLGIQMATYTRRSVYEVRSYRPV
jgi:hypothetical protein